MESVFWAQLLKPLLTLVLWGVIVIPVALLIRRALPEGRLKDFLYKKRKPL